MIGPVLPQPDHEITVPPPPPPSPPQEQEQAQQQAQARTAAARANNADGSTLNHDHHYHHDDDDEEPATLASPMVVVACPSSGACTERLPLSTLAPAQQSLPLPLPQHELLRSGTERSTHVYHNNTHTTNHNDPSSPSPPPSSPVGVRRAHNNYQRRFASKSVVRTALSDHDATQSSSSSSSPNPSSHIPPPSLPWNENKRTRPIESDNDDNDDAATTGECGDEHRDDASWTYETMSTSSSSSSDSSSANATQPAIQPPDEWGGWVPSSKNLPTGRTSSGTAAIAAAPAAWKRTDHNDDNDDHVRQTTKQRGSQRKKKKHSDLGPLVWVKFQRSLALAYRVLGDNTTRIVVVDNNDSGDDSNGRQNKEEQVLVEWQVRGDRQFVNVKDIVEMLDLENASSSTGRHSRSRKTPQQAEADLEARVKQEVRGSASTTAVAIKQEPNLVRPPPSSSSPARVSKKRPAAAARTNGSATTKKKTTTTTTAAATTAAASNQGQRQCGLPTTMNRCGGKGLQHNNRFAYRTNESDDILGLADSDESSDSDDFTSPPGRQPRKSQNAADDESTTRSTAAAAAVDISVTSVVMDNHLTRGELDRASPVAAHSLGRYQSSPPLAEATTGNSPCTPVTPLSPRHVPVAQKSCLQQQSAVPIPTPQEQQSAVAVAQSVSEPNKHVARKRVLQEQSVPIPSRRNKMARKTVVRQAPLEQQSASTAACSSSEPNVVQHDSHSASTPSSAPFEELSSREVSLMRRKRLKGEVVQHEDEPVWIQNYQAYRITNKPSQQINGDTYVWVFWLDTDSLQLVPEHTITHLENRRRVKKVDLYTPPNVLEADAEGNSHKKVKREPGTRPVGKVKKQQTCKSKEVASPMARFVKSEDDDNKDEPHHRPTGMPSCNIFLPCDVEPVEKDAFCTVEGRSGVFKVVGESWTCRTVSRHVPFPPVLQLSCSKTNKSWYEIQSSCRPVFLESEDFNQD